MTLKSDNLRLWNSVCKTDPEFTKDASVSGQKRTAVDAQYKKQMITKEFGPYGKGWGVIAESEKYDRIHYGNETCILTYTATAFYVIGDDRFTFPIAAGIKEAFITSGGKGYLKIDDEAIKKVRTDALTKGFTDLGFCADIHMGLFDDHNYVIGVAASKQIEKEDVMEAAIKEAQEAVTEYCKKEIESINTITNPEQFAKAMLKLADKVTTRCTAAGMNPSAYIKRINQLIEGKKNAK